MIQNKRFGRPGAATPPPPPKMAHVLPGEHAPPPGDPPSPGPLSPIPKGTGSCDPVRAQPTRERVGQGARVRGFVWLHCWSLPRAHGVARGGPRSGLLSLVTERPACERQGAGASHLARGSQEILPRTEGLMVQHLPGCHQGRAPSMSCPWSGIAQCVVILSEQNRHGKGRDRATCGSGPKECAMHVVW